MNNQERVKLARALPLLLGGVLLGVFVVWVLPRTERGLPLRRPGADQPPGSSSSPMGNPVLGGRLIPGEGKAVDLPGAWPGFRGVQRNGIGVESVPLARTWGTTGPKELWSVELGEGYASSAVWRGRVYLMDYDREGKQDALRCLALADGREVWRFAYPVRVKRNHGMSRTVPVVNDRWVVALGPKCHVVCADATTGQLKWGLDLVRQFGATVPQWYAGQCPLIEGEEVILAPGGPGALLMSVNGETGQVLWQTPNPNDWKMTHSSVMPMTFKGVKMYVYCASSGVVGVSARDGKVLWETPEWKIMIAAVPSPLVFEDGRIFLSGGYDAGSMMIQLDEQGGRIQVRTLFKLVPEVFGAAQQTPIAHDGHIYGVRPDGRFVCLGLDGKPAWASDPAHNYGMGPFLLADGVIFAMNDSGKLGLIEASPARFAVLAEAQVLKGRDSWGPLALAGGRLLARDFTRLVCLEVSRAPVVVAETR